MSSDATFTLDGKTIPFRPGDTIMDAALRAGEYIPHLCHNPEFKPHGSCRVCVVDIDGRNVSACTQPAAAGVCPQRLCGHGQHPAHHATGRRGPAHGLRS